MPISDILILSNGPGELATWVRPVVKALREQLGDDRSAVRISVVLSPCPNASGKEAEIAQSYPEVDRVHGAGNFWEFLLWGKTSENWDWRDRGVVLFLGGDQVFPVVIGRRLGYRTVIYAEWDARWHSLIDRFGVMKPELVARVPKKYAYKFTVVGDLMTEAGELNTKNEKLEISEAIYSGETIGLLPGSKPAKLAQGVPLCLAIAECIYANRPQTRFVIPVAPTLDLKTLAGFADSRQNPVIELVKGAKAELITPDLPELPYLKTAAGVRVELWTRSPAYDLLSQCSLCFTTVGANTAELAALAVPMIVLLPTQQLDAMRSWDGLPGLLANLPVFGSSFAKAINWIIMQKVMEQGRLYAWPNIWAKTQIVPELLGKLQAAEVAEFALDYLNHPEKLQEMRDRLRSIRGEAGAAQKLAKLVCEELEMQNA
ncbi:lipid-A-disaccharide synthase [Coleofasciculus sp. FACHB-64]|uniref:lipid-A-disaccharide synthase n=1 Tax=Cyanophyceae TaxID=3028117 RepID=UPI0016862EBC|nr:MULTISPECIES: lipid-A-disaccharide synthase [unclassified Coleofasciculus]MBD1837397.1 lipid-A-disaccharide synthase [Coleofasciculus sp. FACHB-501]MBD2044714.1 lipid-A-disaccharide synthase [Coleofasciculus sp. FACHB-64]